MAEQRSLYVGRRAPPLEAYRFRGPMHPYHKSGESKFKTVKNIILTGGQCWKTHAIFKLKPDNVRPIRASNVSCQVYDVKH
eukprot:4206522-Karenia_brevis.AAC.1